MTKCNQRPKSIKYDPRSKQSIDIQLAKIFHCGDPSLIRAVDVLLQASPDVLQDLINNGNCETRVVTLQVIRQHREKTDVSILDLPWLCEDFMQCSSDRGVLPVKFANQLQNLVNCLLRKNVVYEVPNEELQRRTLFFLSRCSFWWVALNID